MGGGYYGVYLLLKLGVGHFRGGVVSVGARVGL